jgi:class 3 adenylate cyclase
MVRCRKTNFGILVGNPPAIGWYQPANFPASLLPIGVTPTTSRRIATRSLRRKMARSPSRSGGRRTRLQLTGRGRNYPPRWGIFSAAPAGARPSALAALQAAPKEIQQHISIDIGLHYGDVAYGNIGSGNRLDFTAVGRNVNILSRLELLCKDVGRPLLMTDTFAVEVVEPVIEIGHFELRGFRRHQAVYALCQREVAEIVGVAEATVKTRMFYARKKLAELFEAA